MPNLVSLTRKSSSDEVASEAPVEFAPVSIHISHEEVEKLGLGKSDVGDEMIFIGAVKVSSVSAHDGGNGPSRSVTLDVLEGAVEAPPKKSQADRLFGKE